MKGGHAIILDPGRSNGIFFFLMPFFFLTLVGKSEEAAFAAASAYPGGLHIGGGVTTENALKCIFYYLII